MYDAITQAAGFTPARVSDQYKINNSLKRYDQHIIKRRSRLLAMFAVAQNAGDVDGKQQVLKQMREFSKKYPGLRISGQTLRRSMKARAKYRQESVGGIRINQSLRWQLAM